MIPDTLDIVGDAETIAQIAKLAHEHGLRTSVPRAMDSVSDALDSPIGPDEIRAACEVITVIATTGTTVVGFFAAVKALLKSSGDGKDSKSVDVMETKSQARLGMVTGDSDLAQLGLRD